MTDDSNPDPDELQARIDQLEQTVEQMLPSRRDLLQMGGGAALGAGLLGATTGGASAGTASTGTIGTTSDPVDLVAEDFTDHNGNDVMELPGDGSVSIGQLQNETGNAGIQTGWDGLVVPVAEGLGMLDAIDPSTTPTPVADAKAKIDGIGSAGRIILPFGVTEEAAELDWTDTYAVDIVGWGYTDDPGQATGSVLKFTDGTDKGFLFSDTAGCTFRDFSVRGPKSGNSTGVFHMDGSGSLNQTAKNNVIDRFAVHTWYGPFMDMTYGAPFQNSIGPSHVHLNKMDAGDSRALINWARGGRCNTFGNLTVYPDDGVSGSDSTIYDDTGGAENEAWFRWLNLGGSAGKIANVSGWATFMSVNYEPVTQNTTTHDLFTFHSSSVFNAVWDMKLTGGPTVDSVYELNPGGQTILGEVYTRNASPTINKNRVLVTDSPAGGGNSVWYFGTPGNIQDDAGEGNGSVRTMDTAGGANA